MIISHRHKFVFFAVPKTATHAIREALRHHLGPDDWEQQVLFGKQSLPIREIAQLQHGHISVRQIRPHLEDESWQTYTKFGFVRNPFDRYVSTCFFLNRNNPDFARQAVPFMKGALRNPRFRDRVLVRPQSLQLTDTDGQVALDVVGRYEDLQFSYDNICERIGIPTTDLARKNPSSHKSYTSYYDSQLLDTVRDFYKEDFRLFDYDDALAGAD